MDKLIEIINWIPWKIINEALFYGSRFSYFTIIILATLGAVVVILKFSCGLNFSQISVFKDKNITEKLTSAFLDRKEKTAQQRMSRGKLNLIQRTMFFLCISDIMVRSFFAQTNVQNLTKKKLPALYQHNNISCSFQHFFLPKKSKKPQKFQFSIQNSLKFHLWSWISFKRTRKHCIIKYTDM